MRDPGRFGLVHGMMLASKPEEVSYVQSYTNGAFDGQGDGHDFYATLWMPPTGWVNNCDGGRAKSYCDYRTA